MTKLKFWLTAVAAIVMTFGHSLPASAQDAAGTPVATGEKAESAEQLEAESAKVPKYRPVLQGKPIRRESGGSRGIQVGEVPYIALLAPETTGYATSPQPDLYWYLDADWSGQVRIVIDNETEDEPLVDLVLDSFEGAKGIQKFSLKDRNVSMKVGLDYVWTVSLVLDTADSSLNRISIGAIHRVETPKDLLAAVEASTTPYFVFAEKGYWFDAIASLSQLIEKHPGRTSLKVQRAALLDQVNLPLPAAFDRRKPLVIGSPERREVGGSRGTTPAAQ